MPIKKHLCYWRASLADAISIAPRDRDLEQAVRVPNWDISSGQVPETFAKILWNKVKTLNPKRDDNLPITVTLMPLVLAAPVSFGVRLSSERKFYPIIQIQTLMEKTGRIVIPRDGIRPCLSRDFLVPTLSDLTVAEMKELDDLYAVHPDKFKEWGTAIEFASKLEALANWDATQFIRIPEVLVIVSDLRIPADYLLQLYDWMITHESQPELLKRLLADPPRLCTIPSRLDPALAKCHVGQMGGVHGLSESQRDALTVFLIDPADAVLAINGPPGTGKTTLLQSIVANVWVDAVADGGDCPLIVASSTNNQAVENVIEAFQKAQSDKDDTVAAAIGGRWIPDIWSYGLSMPSKDADKKAQRAGKKFQTYKEKPTRDTPAVHFASGLSDPQKWEAATAVFIAEFTKHVPMQQTHPSESVFDSLAIARDLLQKRVTTHIAEIRQILDLSIRLSDQNGTVSVADAKSVVKDWQSQAVLRDQHVQAKEDRAQSVRRVLQGWLDHRAGEPLVTSLLVLIGIKGPRIARDRAMLGKLADEHGLPPLAEIAAPDEKSVRAIVSKTISLAKTEAASLTHQATDLREKATGKAADIERWRQHRMSDQCGAEELQILLDTGRRHHAFLWATHYWEARFLLATKEIVNGHVKETSNSQALVAHFRRLAMLCPCFISSLHMLPKWFSGYPGNSYEPLLGKIDLLIIDEAGQVAPEVASGPLALAKRTLIVGDTQQLEPIWGVTTTTDEANSIRFGVASDSVSYESLSQTGRLAANGSVMVMAQMASRFSSFPNYERGMFLHEHRRCLSRIIDYCNQLVYGGRLLPRTDEKDRPRLDLPVLGYAHVLGVEQQSGSSRVNDIEAAVIAQWIAKHGPRISAAYENKPMGSLIGIVTPFAAQATAIMRHLRKMDLDKEKITVGTVHALQGAEREIIIFSSTYGLQPKGTMFFDRGSNMLNVTVSRAKDHFLVFGNVELFSGLPSQPSGLLGQRLFSAPENEIFDVAPAVPTNLPISSITLLSTLEEHRHELLNALKHAKQVVCIVSPYITKAALQADRIYGAIAAATARGAQTIIAVDEGSNMRRETEFLECVRLLQASGAKVCVAKKGSNGYARLHSKLLWVDNRLFITGSFNWFSSARYASGKMLEHSAAIHDDTYSREMIRTAKETVGAVIPEFAEAIKRVIVAHFV